jgi:uncharacterized protein YukE
MDEPTIEQRRAELDECFRRHAKDFRAAGERIRKAGDDLTAAWKAFSDAWSRRDRSQIER